MTAVRSGCDTVQSTVASDTRGPGFQSSHRTVLFTVNQPYRKDPENGPLKTTMTATNNFANCK